MPRVEDTIQKYGPQWRGALDGVSPARHEFHARGEVLREYSITATAEDEDALTKRQAATERAVIKGKIDDIQGQRVDLHKELKRFYDDLNEALNKTVENEKQRLTQLRELNDSLTALTEAVTHYNEVLYIEPNQVDDEDGFPEVSNVPTTQNFNEEKDNITRARKEYGTHLMTVSTTYTRLIYNRNDKKFIINPLELSPTSDPEHPDYIRSILNADDIRTALQNEVYKVIHLVMTKDIAEQAPKDPRPKAPLTIDESNKEIVTEYIVYLLLLERDLNEALSKFDKNDVTATLEALLFIFKKHEEQRNALFSRMTKLDSLTRFFKSLTAIIVTNVTSTYNEAFGNNTLVCDDSLKFSEWLSAWFFLAIDPSKGKEKFENFLIKRLAYILRKVGTQYKKDNFGQQVEQLENSDLNAYLAFIHKILTETHITKYDSNSRAYILTTALNADPDLRDVVFDRLSPLTEVAPPKIDSWVRGVIKHLRKLGSYNPYTSIKSAPAPTAQTTPPRVSPAPSSSSLASADRGEAPVASTAPDAIESPS